MPSHTIWLTYGGGVFKPDEPVDLPEGTRVQVSVWRPPTPEQSARAWEAIRQISESGAFRSGGKKFTRDELHERDTTGRLDDSNPSTNP
ncbi:MAG: antitoxin family protein [Phycisphaerales bacterium]